LMLVSKYVLIEDVKAALTGWETEMTDEEIIYALNNIPAADVEPVIRAVWKFYRNDENRARWKCSNCSKICRRNPHDKCRCSVCGAYMKMES